MSDDFSDIEKAIKENNVDFIKSTSSERIIESRLFNDAIEQGNKEMVESFIVHGVNPTNPSTFFSIFPIEEAASRGYIEIVKLLLSKGCSVNPELGRHAGFATPSSPLARAVFTNQEDMVKYLLENGADQNLRLHADTHAPLYDAVDNENIKIIDLLLTYKPDFKWLKNKMAISLAAKKGHVTILEKFLKVSKIRLKTVKSFYSARGLLSPLEEAVLHNNFECVKVLIKYGANPHASSSGMTWESSPIVFAIKRGNTEILDYLINNGGKFITDHKDMNWRIPNAIHVYEKSVLIKRAEKSGNPHMLEYVVNLEAQIFKEK